MKDLTDKKFGKLLVVSRAEKITGGGKSNKVYTMWNCQCDCGGVKTVKTVDLIRGSVRSCGCINKTIPKNDNNPGDRFSRLTLLSYDCGEWKCLCDCGNETFVGTRSLKSGNTKSCGCLSREQSSKNALLAIAKRRKFDPETASIRRRWQSYKYSDSNCDIDFDNFLRMTKQDCHYCGVGPQNRYNYFSSKSSKGSDFAKEEGLFIYNGLDRIDSSKFHTMDNVAPCCYTCNRAKNNRTLEEFYKYIDRLRIADIKYEISEEAELAKYYKTSVNVIWATSYRDGNISVNYLYNMSQYDCHYCGAAPGNVFNYAWSDKKSSKKAIDEAKYCYNGLDRIDSSKPHDMDNVVPCCRYCNFAKGKMEILEFNEWINRIKEYQKRKSRDFGPDSF